MPITDKEKAGEIQKQLNNRGMKCDSFSVEKGKVGEFDPKKDFMATVFKIRINNFTWQEMFGEFSRAGGEINGYWEREE